MTSPALLELPAILAERQITALENLRDDVGAVLHLEVHDGWLSILQFVEGRQFAGVGLDVRELPVMPDGTHQERFLVLRRTECELKRRWVRLSECGERVVSSPADSLDGLPGLGELRLQR